MIGAGAAGLVAAAVAANRLTSGGGRVVLLEKNSKTGVKILMSGGTRCNLTHDTDARGITEGFGNQARRFLQKSIGAFSPVDLVKMFNDLGVETKVEPTGKIFPCSDRAVEVRGALYQQAIASGADIRTRCAVTNIERENDRWRVTTDHGALTAERIIVTSGGRSWPKCGTTGDAYQWLSDLGHTIVPTRPALVPLVGGADWTHELTGLTLADCVASVYAKHQTRKPLAERRSSLLFTHFGFSGPAAMDVSGAMTAAKSLADVEFRVDLLPEIPIAKLESIFQDRTGSSRRRTIGAVLRDLLPQRLADSIADQINFHGTLSELPKRTERNVVENLKRIVFPINGTKGFAKAEVTAGGVSLAEVDPRTMASRVVPGLFIAGEVLDVDGRIGGYNFQAAFSTGRAAGIAAAEMSGKL